MSQNKGWVKLHRAAIDHHLFEGRLDRLGLWVWLLSKAAWHDTQFDAKGKTVEVKRGQFYTSFRKISDETGMSLKSVRSAIARFQSGNMIGTETGTGQLCITICNYDKYQSSDDDGGTARAQQGHSKGTQNKKVRNKEDNTPISPKGDADLFGETSKPEKPVDPVDILAAVIPRETAQDFVEHRAALKKKLTVLAAERIVKKLKSFPDPVASIDASIENGWSGVFERGPTEKSRPLNEAQKRDDRISRWRDRIERKYGTG